MAHRRKYKIIPHTIIRAGYYYLNIRSSGSMIRISLKTASFEKAFQTISGIIRNVGELGNLKQMDKAKIKEVIDSIGNDVTHHSIALIVPESSQADDAFAKSEDYFTEMYEKHRNYSSADV